MHRTGAVTGGNMIYRTLQETAERKKDREHARMIVGPLIERKRDGAALSPEEWSALVAEYTAGRIPDYQIAALLMAGFLRGLERQERAALTDAVLASGERASFHGRNLPGIHKH